jgi:hypothetical protein
VLSIGLLGAISAILIAAVTMDNTDRLKALYGRDCRRCWFDRTNRVGCNCRWKRQGSQSPRNLGEWRRETHTFVFAVNMLVTSVCSAHWRFCKWTAIRRSGRLRALATAVPPASS